MPLLACRTCGRTIYATSGLEALFPEERRCPRCGALVNLDRRVYDRRGTLRRQDSPDDAGPPPETGERRVEERRTRDRRRPV